MQPQKLAWQSKLILWLVIAPAAVNVAWEVYSQSTSALNAVLWNLGLSALLGLAAWLSRSATPAAAATGALICANLMFSTSENDPYRPWQTALMPVLAVLVLTSLATRFGRKRKERLGTAEEKHGRVSAQVCANLGFASLVCLVEYGAVLTGRESTIFPNAPGEALANSVIAAFAFASLAEAAADTVSSEIGQVLGGQPYMITTLRRAAPGTDGAVSIAGTLAGVLAACIVAGVGTLVLEHDWKVFVVISAGGTFGLLFDSLLGATLERKGYLNNDAVNFLSTISAAVFALSLSLTLPNS